MQQHGGGLFCDIQCYKNNNNKFILKEFAAVTNDFQFHCFVIPPHGYEQLTEESKRHARWNYINLHKIPWNLGSTRMCDLERYMRLFHRNTVVYIKGDEKADFIQDRFPHLRVVTLPQHPSLKTIASAQDECYFHKHVSMGYCALNNAYKIMSAFSER